MPVPHKDDKQLDNIVGKKPTDEIRGMGCRKQLVFGIVSGWATGYVTVKISKTAAIAVGCGVLILKIVEAKTDRKIDWGKFERNAEDNLKKFGQELKKDSPKVKDFMKANTCFAAGFIGGLLVGFRF